MSTSNIFGAVAFENCGSQFSQTLSHGRGFQIGTRNRVIAGEQNFGNAAHAAAADADQMNALEIAEGHAHARTIPFNGFSSWDSSKSTMSSTARGRANPCARSSISAIFPGWSIRAKISAVS